MSHDEKGQPWDEATNAWHRHRHQAEARQNTQRAAAGADRPVAAKTAARPGRLRRILFWLRRRGNPTLLRVLAVYLLGALIAGVGYASGVLGPVAVAAGWVAYVIAGLAVVHAVVGVAAARAPSTLAQALTGWLEFLGAAILGVGFLGKLYGIAHVTGSLAGGTSAAALAGVAGIGVAVGTALYATMLGLGVSLWVQMATLLVANKTAREQP